MPFVRGAAPSHSGDKRSVSCLPSDCISVSARSAPRIVCNHCFVSCALTHTSLHANFRQATPPPPPTHTHTHTASQPRPHLTGLLSPSERAALDMPDNLRIGYAAMQPCPNLPPLLLLLPAPPLMVFCQVTLTPSFSHQRAIKCSAFRGGTATRHLTKLVPAGHFQYLSSLLSARHCVVAQTHFLLYSSHAEGLVGQRRSIQHPPAPHPHCMPLSMLSICVKTIVGEDDPRSFGPEMEFK